MNRQRDVEERSQRPVAGAERFETVQRDANAVPCPAAAPTLY
jgi:hypothetical protein